MTPSKEKTPTTTDNEDYVNLDIREKKTYLPLATAGALGGLCNGGIQLINSNKYKIFIEKIENNKLVTTLNLTTTYEFLLYLFFSIVTAAILAPSVAIFNIGLPNKRNLNRLLISSALFGAFLTITIETMQERLHISDNIKKIEKEKEEVIQELAKEIRPTTKDKVLIPDNIKFKANTLFKSAILSDDYVLINLEIEELKELKEEVNQSYNDGKEILVDKKDKLLDDIDDKISILEEKNKYIMNSNI